MIHVPIEMNDLAFLKLGNVYTDTKSASSQYVALRRFKSFFGITPLICSLIWNKIEQAVPSGGAPKHLLWSLCFLKQYSVEHTRRAIFHADEKTIRKWTWIFVELLSELDVVKFIFLIRINNILKIVFVDWLGRPFRRGGIWTDMLCHYRRSRLQNWRTKTIQQWVVQP